MAVTTAAFLECGGLTPLWLTVARLGGYYRPNRL